MRTPTASVDEPGTLTLHFTGDAGNLQVINLLTNDVTMQSVFPTVLVGDPLFVDMAHGDYRLQATKLGSVITASPAIDFAQPVTGDDRDIVGRPHDQDVGAIADRFGVRDLGAFEMQPISGRIFADGFGDPISLVY